MYSWYGGNIEEEQKVIVHDLLLCCIVEKCVVLRIYVEISVSVLHCG